MLVVGTSGAVYPAAWLPLMAAERYAFLVEVNPYPTEISRAMSVCLRAPSGQVLPPVVEALRALLA
jgi:NAD-dependent deacetylase